MSTSNQLSIKTPIISYGNDYGQFYDTEIQEHLNVDRCKNKLLNEVEYDYYVDNYELTLTHKEHMLEYEYENTKLPGVFSTIGFILCIIKTITNMLY